MIMKKCLIGRSGRTYSCIGWGDKGNERMKNVFLILVWSSGWMWYNFQKCETPVEKHYLACVLQDN